MATTLKAHLSIVVDYSILSPVGGNICWRTCLERPPVHNGDLYFFALRVRAFVEELV